MSAGADAAGIRGLLARGHINAGAVNMIITPEAIAKVPDLPREVDGPATIKTGPRAYSRRR